MRVDEEGLGAKTIRVPTKFLQFQMTGISHRACLLFFVPTSALAVMQPAALSSFFSHDHLSTGLTSLLYFLSFWSRFFGPSFNL
jgi:hypothetical protein